MPSPKHDGGAVFPEPAYLAAPDARGDSIIVMAHEGLSLRDYFAGQAIAGAVALDLTDDKIAAWAYHLADAMIAERSKQR